MRVPFDQRSMSILNRVDHAAMSRSIAEYGPVASWSIAALLWSEADRLCDYGGELDAVLDVYPLLKEAWEITLTGSGPMTDNEQLAEDCYQQAQDEALAFENRLYIACVVMNAAMALEGPSADNAFEGKMSVRIMEEFKNDRAEMTTRIRQILEGNAAFDSLIHSRASSVEQIEKDRDNAKAEAGLGINPKADQ